MIYKVHAIYDDKTGIYTRPFLSITTGEAVRDFKQSANDPNHKIGIHAADFTLFEIGTYDDATGGFESERHINLGCAIEHKQFSAQALHEVGS